MGPQIIQQALALLQKVGNPRSASSVLSLVNQGGQKVYTKLTPQELNVLRNEVKMIPQSFPQMHLDAMTQNLVKGGKELPRDEFTRLYPMAQQILRGAK